MKDNSGSNYGSKPKNRRDAVKASRKNSAHYIERIEAAFDKQKLSPKMRRHSEAILGKRPYQGPILASDIEAKDELLRQLISYLTAWQQQHRNYRYFFVTLFSDEFRVSKSKPTLWLRKLRAKADKALRELDLVGGIAMIEPCTILNPPDTLQTEFAFHVHAVCWAESDYDLPAAKAMLEGMKSWTHSWGIAPTNMKEITPDKGVAAWWGYYMAKHPVDALNVIERDHGRVKLWKTTKGYRDDVMLRLLEGLSQCRMQELFFAVGEGKHLRGPVWRKTREARKLAHPDMERIDVTQNRSFWKRLWKSSRANHKKAWFLAE